MSDTNSKRSSRNISRPPTAGQKPKTSLKPRTSLKTDGTANVRSVLPPVSTVSNKKKEFMYRQDWPNSEDMALPDESPDPNSSIFLELVNELRMVKNPSSVDGKVRLPTAAELAQLPEDLQTHFRKLAVETLRTYLYPRCLMHLKLLNRRRLIENHVPFVPAMTTASLRKYALFAAWPEEVLNLLVRTLHPHCVERGEFLVHEDEKIGSGIYFVVTGSVHQLKKKSRVSKSIGYDNCDVQATTQAPCIFGEFSFLTEEPRLVSVRALSVCGMWILSKRDFHHHLNMLPKDTYSGIIAVAFTKRNQAMYHNYPMTFDLLESHAIFSKCNKEILQSIINKLEPYAVPKQFVLCKVDESAKFMYFVRHGKVGTYRTLPNGEEVPVGTLDVGALLGDSALLHGSNNDLTIRTLTNCDTWRLSKIAFDTVVRSHPYQHNYMMESARLKRQEELSAQQSRYRDVVLQIPLLSPYIQRLHLGRELLALFIPSVYKPLHLLCATALFCDRMIILLKGKVRVGNDMMLTVGECIGYTCVIPHRWAQTALTLDIVEVLELKRDVYRNFLKRHGLLHDVVEDVKTLLFPRAFPRERVAALHASIGHNKSPILYPVSYSDEVNLTEHGFLMDVPHFVQHPARDDTVPSHYWETPASPSRTTRALTSLGKQKDEGPAPPWESVKGTWRKATRHLWLPDLRLELKKKANKKR